MITLHSVKQVASKSQISKLFLVPQWSVESDHANKADPLKLNNLSKAQSEEAQLHFEITDSAATKMCSSWATN